MRYRVLMAESIPVLTVEKGDGDWLIVTFSDGTTAGYVAEELLKLRPHRELSGEGRKEISNGELACQD